MNSLGGDSGWKHPRISPVEKPEPGQRAGSEININGLLLMWYTKAEKSSSSEVPLPHFTDFNYDAQGHPSPGEWLSQDSDSSLYPRLLVLHSSHHLILWLTTFQTPGFDVACFIPNNWPVCKTIRPTSQFKSSFT